MTYTAEQLRRDAIAIERMHGETLTVEWRGHQASQLRAHADALEELASLREQLADRDAEIAALKGNAERMMVEIEDLISLAAIAMHAANNNGGEFDGCSELQSARDAVSDYRAAYRADFPEGAK